MPAHLQPLHLLLIGPGRIGADLARRLRADGHDVRILTRADYGDFAAPTFNPRHALRAIPPHTPAPDAILHLAGLFQIGPDANPDHLRHANADGPIALAEALHERFPHAHHILFLDARVNRPPQTDPPPLRPYLAAKRALAAWALRAARDWGRATGARVNAIAPGPVLPPPDPAHSEKAGECLTPRPTLADIHACVTLLLAVPSLTGQTLYPAAGQHLL